MAHPTAVMLPAQSAAPADHQHPRATQGSVGVGALDSTVYGGTPVAIDPDDIGAAGSALTLSRSDHAHEFLTATAAALTKTAASSEGSSGDGARADHVHATDALPWGIMSPRFTSTANSSAYTDTAVTDFAIADMVVDSTRLYKVHFHCADVQSSAAGNKNIHFRVDATVTQQIAFVDTITGLDHVPVSAGFLWTPTSGTKDLDVQVVIAGGGTFTFNAAASDPRWFWVEDVGPR